MKELIYIFPAVEIKLSLNLLTNLTMCRRWTKALSQWSNKLYLSPERRNPGSAFFFASELKRVDNDFENMRTKTGRQGDSLEPRKCCLVSTDNFISSKARIRPGALSSGYQKKKKLCHFCQNIFLINLNRFERGMIGGGMFLWISHGISHVCLQPACTTAHSDAKIKCCTKLYQFNFSERLWGPNRRHKLPVGNNWD